MQISNIAFKSNQDPRINKNRNRQASQQAYRNNPHVPRQNATQTHPNHRYPKHSATQSRQANQIYPKAYYQYPQDTFFTPNQPRLQRQKQRPTQNSPRYSNLNEEAKRKALRKDRHEFGKSQETYGINSRTFALLTALAVILSTGGIFIFKGCSKEEEPIETQQNGDILNLGEEYKIIYEDKKGNPIKEEIYTYDYNSNGYKSTENIFQTITETTQSKTLKEEEKEVENYISAKDFFNSVEVDLSEQQKISLNEFQNHWTKNYSIYYRAQAKTGVPAELIGAIHWREAEGNFHRRLHDGRYLNGITEENESTTPIDIEKWLEGAKDALTNYGARPKDIVWYDWQTYLNYAEHYNGMGYDYRGLESPYVWAGTEKYEKGKYVSDGQYDPNHIDNQVGVYVLLKSIPAQEP